MPKLVAKAAFPLDDVRLAVLLDVPVSAPRRPVAASKQGLSIKSVQVDAKNAKRVVVTTGSMRSDGVVVDTLTVKGLVGKDGKAVDIVTPAFIHGVKDPTELKALQLEPLFPFASKLVGVHVSVSCCTGCNGGVHDRNLVVLNHHVGGPWTGIWVQTGKTIEAPYPRWQKILCAGGVIADRKGSVTVVDEGWMEIHKRFEEPHHAPPALRVTCAQVPNSRQKGLLLKGLDASWVEFNDIKIESAEVTTPTAKGTKVERLPRNTIVFTDQSGGRTMAYLYQPTGLKVRAGAKLSRLRGFVHAEAVGQYVMLSDKEEDIAA